MIAIWPAGPPKLDEAELEPVAERLRARLVPPAGRRARRSRMLRALALSPLASCADRGASARGRSVRARVNRVAARDVERVVDEHPPLAASRGRRRTARTVRATPRAARRLRREVQRRRVGAADDSRELARAPDRRARAVRMNASKLHSRPGVRRTSTSGDVVRRRAVRGGERAHLGGRHVEELRRRIDEAADEPRARDAVDLRPLARDPARRRAPRHASRSPRRASPRGRRRGAARRSRARATSPRRPVPTSCPRTQ